MAVDLDLSLIQARMQNLELRQADILAGPVERGAFDLVTARAVLHHIADPEAAIANMIASLREGGALVLIEPDFLPISIAEPQEVRAFWNGWLAWSRERGIDYHIGRTLAPRVTSLGLTKSTAQQKPRSTTVARCGQSTGLKRLLNCAAT